MAIRAHTTVFQATREDDRGRTVKTAHTYSFASVAQNDFTYPISLAGAKSVWVSTSSVEAAEFYLPLYEAGAIDVDTNPTALMQTSFVSDGSSERAGIGFDLMAPSTSGAGFIGGNNMPPALSVKQTGSTTSTILIHITY
jgi:hypothetical protein|tara:strand:+ start:2294 stop:2713 length:420 start_codon:yes stop_codon:yes gene_type:complete